jgi:cell division septum initiation protein DivIVA
MTTNPPGNDSGTPIHDRTAAAEGHEIHPGVTVPAWADTTPLEDGRDADLLGLGDDSTSAAVPASEQLPATPSAAGLSGAGAPGSATGSIADHDLLPDSGSTAGISGGPSSGGSSSGGSGSDAKAKADAAKGAAQDVAGDAKEKAANVAGTAKEQAANVASEATDHAKQLYGQASENLKQQAGEQQKRAASGLKSLGEQLGRMAENDEEQGVASRVVRDLSGRASSAAGFLENRDPGSLLDEVKSFAAKRPGAFIAMAAGAGILAGRLTKAITTEVKHEKEADATGTGTTHTPGTTGTGTTGTTGTGTGV